MAARHSPPPHPVSQLPRRGCLKSVVEPSLCPSLTPIGRCAPASRSVGLDAATTAFATVNVYKRTYR
jgi:hypothetical protein